MNDPSADATAKDTQNNTTVVSVGGGHVVAAFNDSGSYTGANNHFTGYSYSDDDGTTWTDGGTLPNSAEGDGGNPVLANGNARNRVYLSTIGFTSTNTIQVFRSDDFGHTWLAPVNGMPGIAGGDMDKPWMAVDNFPGTGNGNVYLCATNFGGVENIVFTRSTNGGATFGPSGATLISTGGQGCNVAVGPSHQVNVFYYRGTGPGGQGGTNRLYLRQSNDGGQTFQPEVTVATLATSTTNGDLGLNGGFRSNSFPQAAVNPVVGNAWMYVVYNDRSPNGGDIWLTVSRTGANWSAPARVNDIPDVLNDQFFPSIAFVNGGQKLMIAYYSRKQDPQNMLFHRRAILGTVQGNGTVAFEPSFQLGPNTPVVIGQDPAIEPTDMGDYDGIAGIGNKVVATWSDNRSGNSFHDYQPDVHFARIATSVPAANLNIRITASPSSILLGQNSVLTITVSATGGTANDVFVNTAMSLGLAIRSISSASGSCATYSGLIGCSLGAIGNGTSKTIQIEVMGAYAPGARTAIATTTASTHVGCCLQSIGEVKVKSGGAVGKVVSTGNIAVPINDLSTVDVPLNVPVTGALVNATVRLRLNHTNDSDLVIYLVSPTGKIALLSNRRGDSGADYGNGANNCSGAMTFFNDFNTTTIASGAAPFVGNFRPDTRLTDTFDQSMNGTWKLRVRDTASGGTGTIGCFQLDLSYHP